MLELIIVNNESLSPQEEMIQDLISIIHVFSCRIYGLRKYKKKIKEDDEIVKSIQSGDKTNSKQILKIHKTIGVSRFIYNFYIAYNKEIYEKEKSRC